MTDIENVRPCPLEPDFNFWPVEPERATVSVPELEAIRTIDNVIHKGRVVSISSNEVRLQKGSYKPDPGTIFIDCSADGLAKLDPVPVFQGKTLYLQSVRPCQQVFSAALIAHVESSIDDEEQKNRLCRPIPHAYVTSDWLVHGVMYMRAKMLWEAVPQTRAWLAGARLNMEMHQLPKDEQGHTSAEDGGISQDSIGLLDACMRHLYGVLEKSLPEKEWAEAKAIIGDLPCAM